MSRRRTTDNDIMPQNRGYNVYVPSSNTETRDYKRGTGLKSIQQRDSPRVGEGNSGQIRRGTGLSSLQGKKQDSLENKQPRRSVPQEQRISARKYDAHKKTDPFSSKALTPFAQIYKSGALCCHISHGSIHNRLQWDCELEDVDYRTVLLACAEGLVETVHPYVFVARQAFSELINAEGAVNRVIPLLPAVMLSIRKALSHKSGDCYGAALTALRELVAVVGPHVEPHLGGVLSLLNRKIFDRALGRAVVETLETIEMHGGPKTLAIIKSKVPTYQSVM